MPYKLDQFLGAAIPSFVQRSSQQTLGTGRAIVDIVRMPGGRLYDNHGSYDSPRDLDSISKSGYIYPLTGNSIRQQLEALRARLGAKGRLDLLWHDDQARWIMARFTGIQSPRRWADTQQLPITLTYTPVDTFWYADEQEVEEVEWSTTLTEDDFVIANAGNVPVQDVRVEFVSPYDGEITITLTNLTSSQQVTFTAINVDVDFSIVMDTGRKSVRLHEPAKNIVSIERMGNSYFVESATAHALTPTTIAYIEGAGDFEDGYYEVVATADSTHAELEADPLKREASGPETTGTIRAALASYGDTTFSDRANWFWLMPGDNDIHIESDQDLDGGSIIFSFYPTYG